jgi:hypothetical protein
MPPVQSSEIRQRAAEILNGTDSMYHLGGFRDYPAERGAICFYLFFFVFKFMDYCAQIKKSDRVAHTLSDWCWSQLSYRCSIQLESPQNERFGEILGITLLLVHIYFFCLLDLSRDNVACEGTTLPKCHFGSDPVSQDECLRKPGGLPRYSCS